MNAKSDAEIIEELRPLLGHLLSEYIKPCDADKFLALSAFVIRDALLSEVEGGGNDLSGFSNEQLNLMGLVRLKKGRIVLCDSREAIEKELKPVLANLSRLNPYTLDLLADTGTPRSDIDKIKASCSSLLNRLKRKGGRTPSVIDDNAIHCLALQYAQFTKRKPASKGLESLFIKYVHACYSIADSEVGIETIESKIKSFNRRFPFKNCFDDDGNTKRQVHRGRVVKGWKNESK